uniref:Uncharacterized protein n=1 Tax=Ralstonia solanacearum TaxID=305 RepID=A0A0S4W1B8_RALSL|nr:protein of unknown function [Ralstonia solanacearum]CUV33821.1 protein of unknown function [Ralstonia solanacearum]CUV40475.1 protein of unknown function [Ralstonia solanacearum]CUV62887.1 protein of unknown function [Ralstonia solanacearum]
MVSKIEGEDVAAVRRFFQTSGVATATLKGNLQIFVDNHASRHICGRLEAINFAGE